MIDIYMSTKTDTGDLLDNYITITELIDNIRDTNFVELGIGSYKNVQEMSIRIVDLESSDIDHFLKQAKKYKQHSILVVNQETSVATLYYTNGKIEVIGKFKEVQKKPEGDFSYFGESFYIVE